MSFDARSLSAAFLLLEIERDLSLSRILFTFSKREDLDFAVWRESADDSVCLPVYPFTSVYKNTSDEDKHRVMLKIKCACHARFRLTFFIEKNKPFPL